MMGILVALLMDDLLSHGVTEFDMGLGDFPYKADWTKPETVFDAVIPLTARGRLAVGTIRVATRIRRLIKQNKRLWSAAKSVRWSVYVVKRFGSRISSGGK